MPEKKEFFTLRKDMLEKKYFFIITERRRENQTTNKLPLSPNNEINKPTVSGYSDGEEIL